MPRGQSGDGELHAVVSDFAFALARRLRVVRAPDLSERLGELTDLPPVDVALAGAINEGPGCRLLAEIEVSGLGVAAVETVHVLFKPLTPADVQAYVTTAEGLGKAGAYAIQGRGADLIEGIKGDYTAAVGLPLRLLARLLADQGVVIPVDLDMLYDRKPYPNWDRFPSLRRPLNQLH